MEGPVLVVDDDPMARRAMVRAVARCGRDAAATDARDACERRRELGSCVVLARAAAVAPDGFALLRSLADGSAAVIVFGEDGADGLLAAARRAGAADVLTTPVTHAALARALDAVGAEPDATRAADVSSMLTADPAMETTFALARRVAATDVTVLIHGETGTGKEVLARAIHRASRRAAGPFIAVNCAALPASLIEAELYGHEKGAFTGAVGRRVGRFEAATGGTLLLDEVGEIPLELQAKLLRTLQEGEIVRVGSNAPVKVDVRVVAITNRDLRRDVAEGTFRADLFYRLNVVTLRPPALRDRPADIPLLARHFLEKYAPLHRSPAERFGEAALECLVAHRWPGNVRELENVVQRAVILCPDAEVGAAHVILEEAGVDATAAMASGRTIRELERDVILSTLDRLNGNRTHAAKALGVTARTIRNRLRKYRLSGLFEPGAVATE